MRGRHLSRHAPLAFVGAGLLVATSAVAAGASPGTAAAAPTRTASSTVPMVAVATAKGSTTLTVTLQPSDRSRFDSLLTRTARSSRAQRLASLSAVAPSAGERSQVAAAFRAKGFSVTPFGPWAIHVTAPTATATSSLGITLLAAADGTHRPSGAPVVPASVARFVTGVVGLDTRHKFHADPHVASVNQTVPRGGFLPADLRAAYRVPAGGTGAGVSVATLQLAPWNSGDLQTFSNEHLGGVTPNYSAISVDAGTASPASATDDGHAEVALDQETILGQAPQAAQRAYFAPNSDQGDLDVLLKMAQDSVANRIATASSSWGECEADSSMPGAESDAVTALVATGTTFFAASGDDGAYDCAYDDMTGLGSQSTTPAVDLPAADPATVATGGTTLSGVGPPPLESAWSGGGGGQSGLFSRPTYQSSLTVGGAQRLVPDLAEDADPDTGATIYDSEPIVSFPPSPGGDLQAGGTSLAAPLAAGAMAATLTASGCSTGVGDIHAALYRSSNLNDVTTGRNNGGQSASTGGFAAGTGYDEGTGLGSPKWDSLISDLEAGGTCAASAAASLPDSSMPVALVLLGVVAGSSVFYRRRRSVVGHNLAAHASGSHH